MHLQCPLFKTLCAIMWHGHSWEKEHWGCMWGSCKSVWRDGLHLGAEAQLFSMPKWPLQLQVSALLHQNWSTGMLLVSVGIINTAVFDRMIMVYRTPRAREGETTHIFRNVMVKWPVVFLNPGYQNQMSLLTQDRTRNTAKKLPKINQNKTPPPTTTKQTTEAGKQRPGPVRGQRASTVSLEEGTSRPSLEKQPLGSAALSSYRLSQKAQAKHCPQNTAALCQALLASSTT